MINNQVWAGSELRRMQNRLDLLAGLILKQLRSAVCIKILEKHEIAQN